MDLNTARADAGGAQNTRSRRRRKRGYQGRYGKPAVRPGLSQPSRRHGGSAALILKCRRRHEYRNGINLDVGQDGQ
jgi:hypothetical protein